MGDSGNQASQLYGDAQKVAAKTSSRNPMNKPSPQAVTCGYPIGQANPHILADHGDEHSPANHDDD